MDTKQKKIVNGTWYRRSMFGGWEYRIQRGCYTHITGPFPTKAAAIRDANASQKYWMPRRDIRKRYYGTDIMEQIKIDRYRWTKHAMVKDKDGGQWTHFKEANAHITTLQTMATIIKEIMAPFREAMGKLDAHDTLYNRQQAERTAYYAAQQVVHAMEACPECRGTGEIDSGGVDERGQPIIRRCHCQISGGI